MLHFTLSTGSNVLLSAINVTASAMTDFIRIEGADYVNTTNTVRFDTIDSSAGGTALDITKSALISIANT